MGSFNEGNYTDFVVGKIYILPVLSFIPYNRSLGFLCEANGQKIKVNTFTNQLGKSIPKTIPCRVISVNDFGFPSFEQVTYETYCKERNKYKQSKGKAEPVNSTEKDKVQADTTPTDLPTINRSINNTTVLANKTLYHQDIKFRQKVDEYQKHSQLDLDGRLKSTTCSNIPNVAMDSLRSSVTEDTTLQESSIMDDFLEKLRPHHDLPVRSNTRKISTDRLSDYIWNNQCGDFKSWFIETGGVLDRYIVLLDLAEQLLSYHIHDKIYKELSADKVIIKYNEGFPYAELPHTEYFKCDASNIYVDTTYAAPEIARFQYPNTQMSDSYSFGLIAYHILAFCHPFQGDSFVNGSEEDKNKTQKGFLPWIEDPNDNSNRVSYKLYDDLFITEELLLLFHKTFEDGRFSIISRPSMFEWVDALKSAFTEMTFCTNCNTYFLYSKRNTCAFCGSENVKYSDDTISVTHGFWIEATTYNKEKNDIEKKYTIEEDTSTQSLMGNGQHKCFDRNLLPIVSNDSVICKLQIEGGRLRIETFVLLNLYSIKDNSLMIKSSSRFSLKLSDYPEGIFLATKDLNNNQPILILRPWQI